METIVQIMMAATAGQNSVPNPGLNKGPLCSIKMQGVDVKNIRIIVVIVNRKKKIFWKCAGFSRTFFYKGD